MRWVGEEETLVRPFLRKRKRKTIYPEKKAPYRKCEIVTNAGKQLVPLTSLSHVTWQTRSYLLKNLRVLDDYLLGTPFTKPFIALPGSNSFFFFFGTVLQYDTKLQHLSIQIWHLFFFISSLNVAMVANRHWRTIILCAAINKNKYIHIRTETSI